MAKAVVCALLAAAFFLLLLTLGPSNSHHHGHSRLNRRLGDKLRAPNFDPLVAKIERYTTEQGLKVEGNESSAITSIENNSFFGEVVDAKKYVSDEGKLNITLRLLTLFPLLDNAPQDGVVSPLELNSWVRELALERLNYSTQKDLASHDRDGDKSISFREYLPQFSDEDIEKNGMGHGDAGWWKQQFVNADVDRNGSLSFDEFKDFLHPEDSDNEEIKKWLLKEKLEKMDYDKDGKLSFEEFCDHTYDIYKSYAEYETKGRREHKPEEKFAELDLDKDRFLTVEELIPILGYIHPGELSYAKYYASYLIHEADDNKDGNLTLEEMLNHEYIFYSTVYDDSHEDYDEIFHEEL